MKLKLRKDELGMIFEDLRKELTNLKERMIAMENRDGGSEGTLTMKDDIDTLNKEIASLKSTDLSSFWDGLEKPSRVGINAALDDMMDVDALGEGNEEDNRVRTLEIDEEELGVKPNQEECVELAMLETQIVNTVKKTSLHDTSMIGTSDVHDPET